jgi:N-acetylneuraminate synthase
MPRSAPQTPAQIPTQVSAQSPAQSPAQIPAMSFEIAGRRIGPDAPPYIVAELSGNHNGSLSTALALLEAAAGAGADAVKLQTYTADTLTIDCERSDFIVPSGLWAGRSLYELYQEAHTPWEWHPVLYARARELGVTIFSTPFDETAVDFLEELDTPLYKVASFELVDLPLIERIAATGKPVVISTGMASDAEIAEAVETLRSASPAPLVLLHCVSAYPAPLEQMQVARVPQLGARFRALPGLSDHSLGTTAAVAATALGACLIEKHVVLDRSAGGVDAAFSLEPAELAQLVSETRRVHTALGSGALARPEAEAPSLTFRRSLYAVRDIAPGEPFTRSNVRIIRPGHGLPPREFPRILQSRAAMGISRGTPLTWELVAERAA